MPKSNLSLEGIVLYAYIFSQLKGLLPCDEQYSGNTKYSIYTRIN